MVLILILCYIIGNSWGGMLASEHALLQPPKLHKLVIADSPASMVDWVIAANKLREALPKEVQETLLKHEKEGTTGSKEYGEAVEFFYRIHVCRLNPWPQDVVDT
jgi:L-proline amide hydrolase